ncbi:Hypothetical protein CINCED_3A015892 [Cinara cedri]|uniref:Uncharacterized protein n=1 Tax=Cinara cedri TaxID=506608 RepID=A0A5E4NAQ7_9HEMI|nr:Hypothetical protein CINCED_3A015892 [Cinara cedri]
MVPITLTSAEQSRPSPTRPPYPQMADMTEAIPRAFSLMQMAEAEKTGVTAGGSEAPGDEDRSQPRSLFSLSPLPANDRRPVEPQDERVREEGANDGDDEEEEEHEGEGEVDDDDDDDEGVEEEEEAQAEEESSENEDECDETSEDEDDDDDDDEEDSCA